MASASKIKSAKCNQKFEILLQKASWLIKSVVNGVKKCFGHKREREEEDDDTYVKIIIHNGGDSVEAAVIGETEGKSVFFDVNKNSLSHTTADMEGIAGDVNDEYPTTEPRICSYTSYGEVRIETKIDEKTGQEYIDYEELTDLMEKLTKCPIDTAGLSESVAEAIEFVRLTSVSIAVTGDPPSENPLVECKE